MVTWSRSRSFVCPPCSVLRTPKFPSVPTSTNNKNILLSQFKIDFSLSREREEVGSTTKEEYEVKLELSNFQTPTTTSLPTHPLCICIARFSPVRTEFPLFIHSLSSSLSLFTRSGDLTFIPFLALLLACASSFSL